MTQSNATNNSEPNQSNNRRSFYIILIVLLIIANGVLVYMHLNSSKKNVELEAKRKEADSTLAVVNSELQSKITEYQQLMGENATLDSTLKSNIEELQKKQGRIDELIKQKNFSVAELKKAQEEIAALRADKDQFVTRIDSLSTALKYMTQVNDSLSTTLKGKIAEGEQLKSDKKALTDKVNLASLLIPANIKVTGVKYNGKGKESDVDKAKKVEKLKICFEVPINQVADAGDKTMLIAIQDPSQSTIYVEGAGGSGTFNVNGEQKKYTLPATFTYDNQRKTICAYWSQSNPFAAGTYKVQFYQDNTAVGEPAEFKLK